MSKERITIITGQPANGKTTVGRLMQQNLGFTCIEGDDFITPSGKVRLNNGSWNDVDRKIYLSHMAATAVEANQADSDVIVVDCLTTRWMREFLIDQIHAINLSLAVGFILITRNLSQIDIEHIADIRHSEGHALDIAALIGFRKKFESWNPQIPCIQIHNPGNGDLRQLLQLSQTAFSKLWKL